MEDGAALYLIDTVSGPHRNRDQVAPLAVRQFYGMGPIPLLYAGDGDLPGIRKQRRGLLARLGGLILHGDDGQ